MLGDHGGAAGRPLAGQLTDLISLGVLAGSVPREVVVHDELPRNTTGKVLKKDLG